MEESVRFEFRDFMEETFALQKVNVDMYSPLVLAYIGDCVFDLIIKTITISGGNKQVQKLHEQTSTLVQASAQSAMMRAMQDHLDEEERTIYKRGRNAKSVSVARNQSVTDYRRATGFEALLGYLYLKKRYKRLLLLVKTGLDSMETTP